MRIFVVMIDDGDHPWPLAAFSTEELANTVAESCNGYVEDWPVDQGEWLRGLRPYVVRYIERPDGPPFEQAQIGVLAGMGLRIYEGTHSSVEGAVWAENERQAIELARKAAEEARWGS